MANQYSRYQLQPYVSQYVNPYSVEVNTILRERWDQNKAQKDKIDVTLGSWNTLPGDTHLVDKAKGQVKNKLSNFIDYGNYEDATMAISETLVDLESDRGLKAAQQSYKIRQEELAFMRESTIKNGTRFLDFGRGHASTHSSYYKDEEGKYVENVYQPLNEPEHDYDAAMGSLLKTIKADWSGISRSKADGIANGLLPLYLNGTEGDQDYRQLTQLDGMNHAEALENIRQRLQGFTDQYIHTTKAAAIKSAASSMSGKGALNKGYTAMRNDDYSVLDHYNTVLSGNGDVFRSGDTKNIGKISDDTKRIIQQQARAALNDQEYAGWKKRNVDGYRGHEAFGSWVGYSVTNTNMPTMADQEGIDWGQAATVGGVGTVAVGAGMLTFGAANAWNPLGWVTLGALGFGYLVGMGASVAGQVIDQGTSEQGNVRDWQNPQQGDGLLFGLLDSEAEEFDRNMEDTDHINKLLGTDYKNGDPVYEQLKKNAREHLLYNQEGGGDEMNDKINDYKGDIFEGETWVPDYNNKEVIAAIERIEKNWSVTDFDILGLAENTTEWNEMVNDPDTDKNEGPGEADIKFLGVIGPSEVDDTPLMFKLSINGKIVLAEGKKNNPMAIDIEERLAMDLNKADFVVVERARQWMNQVEDSETGEGPNKEATGQQLLEQLAFLYENITGMGNTEARNYAELRVFNQFVRTSMTETPNGMIPLRDKIMYQKFGVLGEESYTKLTAEQKSHVDGEMARQYEAFKLLEVRR